MKKTILIIEDNNENMYLMAFLLITEGYRVIEAESGMLGIDLAISKQPDLILLDIQLSEMDGHELVKELASNDLTRDIPIVAVTSYAMVGDREKAMASGAEGYIEKPIDPDTFAVDVEKFFRY